MQNPRLAGRYAKSLLDLALESGKLDSMYSDMQSLQTICNENPEFITVIKSPVVKADSKANIIKAILEGKVDNMTFLFLELIIRKGREFHLPEIISSFIALYKVHNHINEVVITTAEPLDENVQAMLQTKIQAQFTNATIELKSLIDPTLVGGFVLEANNKLFDASILRDLKDIKKQFMTNEFVPNLR